MKKIFTPDYILANRGCYETDRVISLSFMKYKRIHLRHILESELPLKDRFWWLIKNCNLTQQERVKIAVQCAEMVLPLFEKEKPNDIRPRKAIDITNKWLNNEIPAHAAARAAHAAAHAARAVDAAAHAAVRAAHAAAHAARAVDAAVHAARAVDAAVDAAHAAVDAAYADISIYEKLENIIRSVL